MHRVSLLAAVVVLGIFASFAQALPRVPQPTPPVAHNPANRFLGQPIEASAYDPATHCNPKPHPGMIKLQRWLGSHVRGVFWGSYRCEMWGKDSASLHAENRAIDWHLDVTNRADRRAATKLIDLLLAPDAAGNPQALARRMGIEELIWDCGYWGAGMSDFEPYAVCYTKGGKLRKHIDPTAGHRNHIHIGMTKAGAAAKTSFWR